MYNFFNFHTLHMRIYDLMYLSTYMIVLFLVMQKR